LRTSGSKRSAKQEITETIKFLTWLEDTHGRTAAECTQHDVDAYLTSGPTTRHLIRTFFIWAKSSKINTGVQIGFRQARTTPTITQEQRLGWLKELLTGDAESLPYRVAGILLLLYAQPLTKIAALQATAVTRVDGETRIALGREPIPVPEPFASQLNYHLHHRPNLRTAGGAIGTPWLFPSCRPGQHLDPQTIMHRLRWLGINLLGSRNTALQELVSEIPAPLVADMLGYSDQVTQKHAAEAGKTWAAYVSPAPESASAIPPHPQQQHASDGLDLGAGDQLALEITVDENVDDIDPPASPVHAHVDALAAASNAIKDARAALAAAEGGLTQAVLHAYQSGLSWARIAATLGISRQAAYQRWAAHVRTTDSHDAPENPDGSDDVS
jgi:hypothetical protein